MDINANTEVKGYGLPVGPSPMEKDDHAKPRVTPVREGAEAAASAMNERALHGAGEEKVAAAALRTRKEIEKAMEEVQKRLDAIGGNLRMGLEEYKETQEIVVEIRDKRNNEVVRQFPSEDLLKLRAKLDDVMGLLFDQKA